MKLFWKFLIYLSLLAILPSLFLFQIFLKTSNDLLKENLLKRFSLITESFAVDIENYFTDFNKRLSFVLSLDKSLQMNWTEKYKLLNHAILKNTDFLLISLVDTVGKPDVEIAQEGISRNINIFPLKNSKDVFFSSIYYQKKIPCIDFVYPLNTPGKYVLLTISLKKIFDKLNSLNIGTTGLAYIMENDKIIGHENRVLVIKDLTNEKNGFIMQPDIIGTFSSIQTLPWKVVFVQEINEAFFPLTSLKRSFYATLFIIIILASGFSFFIARGLSDPIISLVKKAEKIGNGDLDQIIIVKTKDEIALLAKTFNKMVKDLKKYQENLIKNERLAAVGEMANIIGHDIRNPLGVINNSVFLLRKKIGKISSDPKFIEYLDIIQSEVVISNKIIEDLLGFSRTKPPTLGLIDLTGLIREAVSVVEANQKRNDVKVLLELPASLNAKLDSREIRQVLVNIINNAFQAIQDKEGKVEINANGIDDNIEISITDNGSGISDENLGKIFDAFFSTKRGGTGLGLAACKRIIERHNGKMLVESKINIGTKFTIILPKGL